MKKCIREISLSFCLTFIILGGILVLILAHYRMQNTVNASDYTFIELYRIDDNKLEVFFDNEILYVDLNNINNFREDLSAFEIFVPVSIKIVDDWVQVMISYITDYIVKLNNI